MTRVDLPQTELLGVLADVLHKDDWDQVAWLGPEAWQACPLEVAGGLWMEGAEPEAGFGKLVAEELQRRSLGPGPVVAAKRVVPGEGTLMVWYRHLN